MVFIWKCLKKIVLEEYGKIFIQYLFVYIYTHVDWLLSARIWTPSPTPPSRPSQRQLHTFYPTFSYQFLRSLALPFFKRYSSIFFSLPFSPEASLYFYFSRIPPAAISWSEKIVREETRVRKILSRENKRSASGWFFSSSLVRLFALPEPLFPSISLGNSEEGRTPLWRDTRARARSSEFPLYRTSSRENHPPSSLTETLSVFLVLSLFRSCQLYGGWLRCRIINCIDRKTTKCLATAKKNQKDSKSN